VLRAERAPTGTEPDVRDSIDGERVPGG
jgi:hypothetical protein